MRVVLDTNVLISAFIWENSVARKLLHSLLAAGTEIYASQEIMLEFQRVLKRDFNLADEDIIFAMKEIFISMKVITPMIKLDAVKDDKDDNKIIECAVAAQAEFILTYDVHLLNLKEYEGIKIIRPDLFLLLL
ncbi:MAG: putative toxin-antitoxin system toxin component, PIN family [Candidatus Nanoarchaeia archaeon]|nr:putative toxin-antitoxin system toxin component, PIN family [Candidatus Nanoarchaeia archaeon]